jgi:type III restriction enzyme
MPDVVIENPIINSPFEEPTRHFYFDQDGITDKITEARRISAYFVPIPPSKKKSGNAQLVLGSEWTKDRQQENKFINDIRNAVGKWRFGGYDGVTNTTRTCSNTGNAPTASAIRSHRQAQAVPSLLKTAPTA